MNEALFQRPAARVTWLCALFLFAYVGVEVALGGWITDFMLRVRHGSPFASGMTTTGYWLGMTVGRVVLGFVTPKIGEKLAILIYLPICLGLELLLWLVPQFYVSTVAVAFQGFFLGPMFPAAVVAATKLLPRHLHVSSIGFAAAFGGCGAAVFPFAVGAIAQAKGVQVLQPVVVALLAVIWLLWAGLPRMGKKKEWAWASMRGLRDFDVQSQESRMEFDVSKNRHLMLSTNALCRSSIRLRFIFSPFHFLPLSRARPFRVKVLVMIYCFQATWAIDGSKNNDSAAKVSINTKAQFRVELSVDSSAYYSCTIPWNWTIKKDQE
jgi:MFS family permease